LAADRMDLPMVGPGIRCPTGCAVRTGPNDYGAIPTPYVVHAVGPNYLDYCFEDSDPEEGEEVDPFAEGHELLQSAYRQSLDRAREVECRQVAFSLLSSGLFRGPLPLELVLELAVGAILDWALQQQGRQLDRPFPQVPQQPPRNRPPQRQPIRTPSDPMEVILCAYSPAEVRALRRACRRVLNLAWPA
jgi:O-acetyl-ADP-ribose deacetylase (regulator of RNase III)